MSDSGRLHGIIPPLITPTQGDQVDAEGVSRLVDHVIEGGVHGVFVAGTTGEYSLLSDDGWHTLVSATVHATRQRVPVLVGVTQNSTAEVIRLAQDAAELGADYVVATTPSYFRHTQQELRDHFVAIAAASPLPLVLYNIPQNTGNALDRDTVVSLAQEPNIVGLKDSSGRLEGLRALRHELADDGFRILLGSDVLGDVTLTLGAHGTVPSLANVAPALLVAAWEAAVSGDQERSEALHTDVALLARLYTGGAPGSSGSFVSALRYAMSLIGVPVGDPLSPIAPLSEEGCLHVKACLECGGYLPS